MIAYVSEWSEKFGKQEMVLSSFEQFQHQCERLGLTPPSRHWKDLSQRERLPIHDAMKEHQKGR